MPSRCAKNARCSTDLPSVTCASTRSLPDDRERSTPEDERTSATTDAFSSISSPAMSVSRLGSAYRRG